MLNDLAEAMKALDGKKERTQSTDYGALSITNRPDAQAVVEYNQTREPRQQRENSTEPRSSTTMDRERGRGKHHGLVLTADRYGDNSVHGGPLTS